MSKAAGGLGRRLQPSDLPDQRPKVIQKHAGIGANIEYRGAGEIAELAYHLDQRGELHNLFDIIEGADRLV